MSRSWLEIERGEAPLVVSIPHTGTDLAGLEPRLVSPWLARKDTDWWVDKLYGFAGSIGATVVRTAVSRTVIDVNRDPSGASLYPGQATTGLCALTTFDGELLYLPGQEPGATEIEKRKVEFFAPYDRALHDEVARLRAKHRAVVLYDCHSIRSVIPRLFPGELPEFNLGMNKGASAAPSLSAAVEGILRRRAGSHVVNGRFTGGWITRSFGEPTRGVHALQMELACRSYLREPPGAPTEANWPPPFDPAFAERTQHILGEILSALLDWAAKANAKP